MTNARLVSTEEQPPTEYLQKVLFLGYDEAQTPLIHFLFKNNCEVWHIEQKIDDVSEYDLVISFGYRHILLPKVIATAKRPIINLHISYLPYNKGAHPNFWSFCEGTPSGVTIHCIDEGIDTGDILCQRYVNFDNGEATFKDTHARLIHEVEMLFEDNLDAILCNELALFKQRGNGTHHYIKDLPAEFSGWDSSIVEEIARLDELEVAATNEKLALIDEIEAVRRNNNVNWMDLLRLAFTEAPDEAVKIVRQINLDDSRISELFKKLGE